MAVIVYTSRTGNPNHAEAVARIHGAPVRRVPPACRLAVPEAHERGEFPMTCYACHVVVNG